MEFNIEENKEEEENMLVTRSEMDLSEKSRERYEMSYASFTKWQDSNNAKSNSENVLLAYFEQLSKKCKPSTMWTHYSMLRSTLNYRHNVDISKYLTLIAFLRKKSVGFQSKKYFAFTTEELKQFFEEAPDEEYLAAKVIAIFGVYGATRNEELANIKKSHVTYDNGVIIVRVLNSKANQSKIFTIEGNLTNIVRKYEELRPKMTSSDRYFLNYRNGRCCINRAIGVHKFAKTPKQIAIYLGLDDDDKYTAHSFSRTSFHILADKGANMELLKSHKMWKSDKLIDGYIQESIGIKRKIANMITDAINCELSASTSSSVAEKSRVRKKQKTDSDVVLDVAAVTVKTEVPEISEDGHVPIANSNAETVKAIIANFLKNREKPLEREVNKCEAIVKEELDLDDCEGTLKEKSHSRVDLRENREEEIRARNSGKAYINCQGLMVPARSMKNLCGERAKYPCYLICGRQEISEKDRQCVFRYFWDLPNRTQKYEYIARHIRLMEPKKRKINQVGTKSGRSYTRNYYLPIDGKLRQVCVTTFLATLDINAMWVILAMRKFSHLSVIKPFDPEVPPPLVPISPITNLHSRPAEENNAQIKTMFFINNQLVPPLVPIRPVNTNRNLTSANKNILQVKTKVLSVNPDPVHNSKRDSEAKRKEEMQRPQAIDAGKPYIRCNGSKHSGGSVRKGCNSYCIFNCHKIAEKQRQKICREFWSIGDRFGKYEYISRLVEQNEIKIKNAGINEPKRGRRKYFLEIDGQFIRVCHLMFIATLDITHFWICSAIKHIGPRAVVSVDDIEDMDIDPIL